MRILATLFLTLSALSLGAQEKVIRLYDGPAPGSEAWSHTEGWIERFADWLGHQGLLKN